MTKVYECSNRVFTILFETQEDAESFVASCSPTSGMQWQERVVLPKGSVKKPEELEAQHVGSKD